MEFLLGVAAGFLLWPWWAILAFILICVTDIVLLGTDDLDGEPYVGWGTTVLIVGTGLFAWLATDVNPFVWVWVNLTSIVKFLIVYFFVGALWSIVKWYFYLLKVRDKMLTRKQKERPSESYARNNKVRIFSWIGHWPFSLVGTFFGDFLSRIVNAIYLMLSGLYDSMADRVFKDFTK